MLKCMSKDQRAKLPGKSGMLAAECEAVQIAKSEKELQAQIAAMLRRNGIYVVIQPTNKRSNLTPGTPDILAVIKGRPIAWEIKYQKGVVSTEQAAAMDQMEHNGWLCDVIRSYDEALNLFNELNK